MSESHYAKDIHRMLASLNEPGDGQEDQTLPEEEAVQEIHVYPVEGGGILLTKEPLEDDPPATIIDSEPPTTPLAARVATQREPPYFLYFVLLLLLFLVMDAANSQLIALLTPTATITITPDVRTMTLQSTAQLGKLLSPITVTESQTVPTTGHGHQDARQATGTLTFYNGLFTAQSIAQGTVFTGSDGVTIATTQPASIPPGNPNTGYGTATVTAQVLQKGAAGNIAAGDITITIKNGLQVKNSQFTGGQDERDYMTVSPRQTRTPAMPRHRANPQCSHSMNRRPISRCNCTASGKRCYSHLSTCSMLNGQVQQRIKTLLAGQPRLTAHVLLQPGIHTASITGIADNQLLPDDLTHLHLLIMYLSF